MMRLASLVLACLLLVGVSSAEGTPITYTQTVTANGSLGGTSFSNAVVTLSVFSDTATVITNGALLTNPGSATVIVAGLGTGSFTDPIIAFTNQTFDRSGLALGLGGAIILATNNPIFATYGMASAVGPVTGVSTYNAGLSFATTAGAFILTGVSPEPWPVTYEATLRTDTPVPEPGTFALMGTVLVGLAAARTKAARKRRASL